MQQRFFELASTPVLCSGAACLQALFYKRLLPTTAARKSRVYALALQHLRSHTKEKMTPRPESYMPLYRKVASLYTPCNTATNFRADEVAVRRKASERPLN